jgi:hypothetical protein
VILDVNGSPAEIPNDQVFILLDTEATAEFLPAETLESVR